MCSVILRVIFAGQGGTAQQAEYDDEASAMKRLEELQNRDSVASVTVFRRTEKYQRATVWEKV